MGRTRAAAALAVGAVVTVLALAGCGSGGEEDGAAGRAPFGGFGEAVVELSSPGERAREWCVLLADTPELRAQGLMGRRDLAGYDAMLFRFGADTTTGFWMKDTPLPLSIAWFDAAGGYVGAADMEPCAEEPCPLHRPGRAYREALEVPRGGLSELGAIEGATLRVEGGSCPG